jgi:DTW domain-containing protein YfiP
LESEKTYRQLCVKCLQPGFGCYCSLVAPFDPKIKFLILIHPIEVRRRIATGRMTHLILKNSELLQGQDYSQNKRLNELLADPQYDPLVLYPGKTSINLSEAPEEVTKALFRSQKTPLVLVIDGTWATAKKMMRESTNISGLPRICFTPPTASRFRVRKQPGVNCYSTIEAVHHCIELMSKSVEFDLNSRAHDNLIEVFDSMVERQLKYIDINRDKLRRRTSPRYHEPFPEADQYSV